MNDNNLTLNNLVEVLNINTINELKIIFIKFFLPIYK